MSAKQIKTINAKAKPNATIRCTIKRIDLIISSYHKEKFNIIKKTF
jgi:hypothetical protein